MNLLVRLITCILIYDAGNLISATDLVCPLEASNIPNPEDCGSYYRCAPNAEPIPEDCPSGLAFNAITQRCDYSFNVDCHTFACHKYNNIDACLTSPNNCSFCCDHMGDDVPQCNTYDNLLNDGCRSFDQYQYDKTVEPNTTCVTLPPGPPVICDLEDIRLPNPADCGSFYLCNPNGVPTLIDCPLLPDGNSMVFNPELQVCDWPQNVDCKIFACHKYNNIDTCLSSPNNCTLCCDDVAEGIPRCNTYDKLSEEGCRSFDQSHYDKSVEPNTTCVILTPGQKRNISVTFTLEKHPLDFYFLMDTTGSMTDDKDNLVTLSSSFLETLNNLTNDFHIGFGTFKDKPVFPSNPDDYSFRNDMRLTSQIGNFLQQIEDVDISGGGGDGPESCGDALTQVVECYGQIGWRDNTRRVVLVATDDIFHEEEWALQFNITKPYVDGCYLDADGYYTEVLTMNFPSVAQIASAYSKTPVTTTVIFATARYAWWWEGVASHFKSAYVAELALDSSNIVELIKNEFARIDSRFEIETNVLTDTVHFKYFSSCMGSDEEETAICENMPPEGEVSFTVEIDLPECPVDADDTEPIDFRPVGLPVSHEVQLSFLCDDAK
ncbi:integrin beta-PS-like [Bradysia coprophila]|uniref:integrin beta-PS-like n=1 Tax=Bradysia coprophila TaxID=38358 RepID=UPI00187DB1B4|nr:integrin beta-PS-like [Bradysia coprophila]